MFEKECNSIKTSNEKDYKNKYYSETKKFKYTPSYSEIKQEKEKGEIKTEYPSKKKSKLLSILMSAVAVTVVAVPQITNLTSVNIEEYTIESTEDTIFYQFMFGSTQGRDEQYYEEYDYDSNYNFEITVYNDFISDTQIVEGSYIEYTVENLKPNMQYYLKITNNGTLVFKRSITTNYEYYYYYSFEGGQEYHGYRTPKIDDYPDHDYPQTNYNYNDYP